LSSKMELNTHIIFKWVFNKENGRPILFFNPNFNFPFSTQFIYLIFQQNFLLNSYNIEIYTWEKLGNQNKILSSKMELNTHIIFKWVFNKENGRPILFFNPNFNFPFLISLIFQQNFLLNSYNIEIYTWEKLGNQNKISYNKMELNTYLKIRWVFNKENGRPILFFNPNFNFPFLISLIFQQNFLLNSYNIEMYVWEFKMRI
jgi:hypothetical protein